MTPFTPTFDWFGKRLGGCLPDDLFWTFTVNTVNCKHSEPLTPRPTYTVLSMAENQAIDESIVANGSLVNRVSFLEELPPELLHRILEYTLPHGFTFSFRRVDDSWDIFAARGNHTQWVIGKENSGCYPFRNCRPYNDACTVCKSAPNCNETISQDEMQMGLLLVKKAFAKEARGETPLQCLSNTEAVETHMSQRRCLPTTPFVSISRMMHTIRFHSNHRSSLVRLVCHIASISCAI